MNVFLKTSSNRVSMLLLSSILDRGRTQARIIARDFVQAQCRALFDLAFLMSMRTGPKHLTGLFIIGNTLGVVRMAFTQHVSFWEPNLPEESSD